MSHEVLPSTTSAADGVKPSQPMTPKEYLSPKSGGNKSSDEDEKDDEYFKMLIKTEMDKRLREFKKEVVGEAVF